MYDESFECTPPEITEKAAEVTQNLLPYVSRERYEAAYQKFMEWRKEKRIATFSENILIVYFESLSKVYKSSTLWSQHSMLKSTINLKHNIDISKYPKLQAFLKRQSENYVPTKSKILTEEDFSKFLKSAPDNIYLLIKSVVAIGLAGACRRIELCNLTIEDVTDLNSAFLVRLRNTKNKIPRSFTVTDSFYDICKKYIGCRPTDVKNNGRFFLNYKNGKCTKQPVGINKIGGMAKEIAAFLKLKNPEQYTGHCFRRSSATLLVNAGGDLLTLKRHGGWRSSTVAEGYIDESIQEKVKMSNKIVNSLNSVDSEVHVDVLPQNEMPSSSKTNNNISIVKNLINQQKEMPGIHLENCSNFTINYNFK